MISRYKVWIGRPLLRTVGRYHRGHHRIHFVCKRNCNIPIMYVLSLVSLTRRLAQSSITKKKLHIS